MKKVNLKKTIFLFTVLTVAAILLFSVGCKKEMPYNVLYEAKFVDKAETILTEKYLEENKTHYPGEEDNLPAEKYNVINTEEEYTKAFKSFPEEVDFSKDIIIIYIFTDINYGYGCKLQNITNENGNLKITILHELAKKDHFGIRPPSNSAPTLRYSAIKLTNCIYTNIIVELKMDD